MDITLTNPRGDALAIDYCPGNQNRGSVIFCCTPVVPVTEFQICYMPIAHAGFNIYALDFAGIGNSSGDIRKLSIEGICADIDTLAEYIMSKGDAPIYLFGDTGIGGLIGQYYACANNRLVGFAQFGCGIYKDASPLGMSKQALGVLYPVVSGLSKIAPGLRIKASAPTYKGFHADLDNDFYVDMLKRYPDFMKVPVSLMKTLLDILCASDSQIQKGVSVPTLVFKTKHDRYFSESYFDRYYESIAHRKKLVEIDDVHNSYYIYAELFAKHVAEWFAAI